MPSFIMKWCLMSAIWIQQQKGHHRFQRLYHTQSSEAEKIITWRFRLLFCFDSTPIGHGDIYSWLPPHLSVQFINVSHSFHTYIYTSSTKCVSIIHLEKEDKKGMIHFLFCAISTICLICILTISTIHFNFYDFFLFEKRLGLYLFEYDGQKKGWDAIVKASMHVKNLGM